MNRPTRLRGLPSAVALALAALALAACTLAVTAPDSLLKPAEVGASLSQAGITSAALPLPGKTASLAAIYKLADGRTVLTLKSDTDQTFTFSSVRKLKYYRGDVAGVADEAAAVGPDTQSEAPTLLVFRRGRRIVTLKNLRDPASGGLWFSQTQLEQLATIISDRLY